VAARRAGVAVEAGEVEGAAGLETDIRTPLSGKHALIGCLIKSK
jgi:hypothetical protein